MKRCERCGKEVTDEAFHIAKVLLCYICLDSIVHEWKIKRDEINFLGQGRTTCDVNNCVYEVSHLGKHSWQT
jgi:hypothetical protein